MMRDYNIHLHEHRERLAQAEAARFASTHTPSVGRALLRRTGGMLERIGAGLSARAGKAAEEQVCLTVMQPATER